jgi:hypothetical protein
LLILLLLIAVFFQNLSGHASSDARVESTFRALWPKLSNLLKHDIRDSIEVATRCRILKNGAWPPQNNRPASAGMVSDHIWTIRKYDRILARALRQYFRAERLLRDALRNYKWVLEHEEGKYSRVKSRDLFSTREIRQANVVKRAFELEFRADDLSRAVLRCDETMGLVEEIR